MAQCAIVVPLHADAHWENQFSDAVDDNFCVPNNRRFF